MIWKCPKCGSKKLSVDAEITVRLIQYTEGGEDYFETEDEGSDHCWDEDSTMCCRDCNHADEAKSFRVVDQ